VLKGGLRLDGVIGEAHGQRAWPEIHYLFPHTANSHLALKNMI
jgi:hypothetical protein